MERHLLKGGGKLKFFGSEIGNSPFRMVNINMHMGYFLLNEGLKHLSLTKALLYQDPRLSESRLLYLDLAEMLHSHIYI